MPGKIRRQDIPGDGRRTGDASQAGERAGPRGEQESLSGIGAVASRTGVSERTLRYYEELGLLRPAAHRRGGSRLYCESDIERVERIRKLQSLMGFNLEEIGSIFAATDRLEALRDEYRGTDDSGHQHELLEEAVGTLEGLRAQVLAKQEHLRDFLAELDARIERHRNRLASWVELQREGGQRPGTSGDDSPRDDAAKGRDQAAPQDGTSPRDQAAPQDGTSPRDQAAPQDGTSPREEAAGQVAR